MAASTQANVQTYTHTHTRLQCSNASVGLAQARPNEPVGDNPTEKGAI